MSKEQRNELNLKIILIGDAGVGKSSILLRYKTNEFLDIRYFYQYSKIFFNKF